MRQATEARTREPEQKKYRQMSKDCAASSQAGFLNSLRSIAAGILLLLAATQVQTHHAFGIFESQKTITLQGTVRAFQWSNPHCWIQLLVPQQSGTSEWSVEMGSTTELYRSGWRPSTLQAGQKVTIVVHPMRDGSPGARFVSGTAPDGRSLGKAREATAP